MSDKSSQYTLIGIPPEVNASASMHPATLEGLKACLVLNADKFDYTIHFLDSSRSYYVKGKLKENVDKPDAFKLRYTLSIHTRSYITHRGQLEEIVAEVSK